LPNTASSRRHDLDVLRVGAFFLLILYHIGMLYAPWWWHVKSHHMVTALTWPMGLLNPWRLTLLFVISGIATRFMGQAMAGQTDKVGKQLAGERSLRLLVPLMFGILVIVPPQSWVQMTELKLFQGNFWDFYRRYLSADQSFGVVLPTYNHLWFVAYLWLYTMAAALIWPLLPWLDRLLAKALSGPGLWLFPAASFGLLRVSLYPAHPETNIVWDDLYAHLHYGLAFALGLGLANLPQAWDRLAQYRHRSAGLALVICAFCVPLGFNLANGVPVSALSNMARSVYAWFVIAALFGYARQHITHGNKTLTVLTEAVFPFYIIHQTAIVLIGYALKPLDLPLAAEVLLVISVTGLSCLAAYGLARALPILRLPLGLKPLRTRAATASKP
jgi:glucan biosynthesis protein C